MYSSYTLTWQQCNIFVLITTYIVQVLDPWWVNRLDWIKNYTCPAQVCIKSYIGSRWYKHLGVLGKNILNSRIIEDTHASKKNRVLSGTSESQRRKPWPTIGYPYFVGQSRVKWTCNESHHDLNPYQRLLSAKAPPSENMITDPPYSVDRNLLQNKNFLVPKISPAPILVSTI